MRVPYILVSAAWAIAPERSKIRESVAPLNAVMLFRVPGNDQSAILLYMNSSNSSICRTERNPASSTHNTCPFAACYRSLFVWNC